MSRAIKRITMICLSLILLTATHVGAEEEIDLYKFKIMEIYDLISHYHLNDITPPEIMQGAILGMLAATKDPYTEYFTDQEIIEYMDGLNGSYVGVGVQIEERKGQLIIHRVYPGSPAEQAGLRAGDQIAAINGKEVNEESIESAIMDVTGEEGTNVKFTIKRNGKVFEVNLIRKQLEIPLIEAKLFPEGIGYVELSTFSDESIQSFEQQMKKWKKEKLRGLILDLRDNPGGLLSSAIDLTSVFQKEGPVVYVKDREGKESAFNTKNGEVWDIPLVILVNELSASASEIVAAALQEYGKAKIIGTQTFGKGTVQELIPLETGGVLKMSIEEYFTPKHQRINHIGVKPDIIIQDPDKQLQAAREYF